ncbi:MAG: YHS domain-containing protein [Burkholderiaceae bacterium]
MNEQHMPESNLAMPRRDIPKRALQAKPGTDVTATFCFVDIAGYTALTDTHGEHAAADLVEAFARMLRSAVASRGHVQELAGDNAFLVFPEPKSAIEAILNLYRDVEQVRGFPILRTGLHHGSALYRANRYFGTTINTAARIAAQATGGEILCTAAVVDAVARLKNPIFTIDAIGSVKLKNLPQEVKTFSVNRLDHNRQSVIDPVCQMQVEERTAAATQEFNGRRYWFCSAGCADRFAIRPSDFI